MNSNPYAAPDSDVVIEEKSVNHRFYVVSPTKFLIMYLGTLGIYEIYWFYKHWAQFKIATKGVQWPVMRAIFPIFFVHSLNEEIAHSLKRRGEQYAWSPGWYAAIIIILIIITRILDRMAYNSMGSPTTDIVSFLIMPVICIFLYRVQRAANIACGDPEGKNNSRFTAANYAWLGFGFLLWLLSMAGIYMMLNPDAFPE